jgi:tetratricopeptide (TPR) repeat protein
MTTLQEEDELFGASLSMDFYLSPSTPKSRPWLAASPPRQPFELLDDVPPATFRSEEVSPRYPVDELYPIVDASGNGEPAGLYDDDDDDDESNHTNTTSPISHNSFTSATPTRSNAAPEMKSRYLIDDEYVSYSDDAENHYYDPNRHHFHLHQTDGRLGTITESRSDSDSDISEYQPMNKNYDVDNDDNGDHDYVGDIYSVQESVNHNELGEKTVVLRNNRFQYSYDDDFSEVVDCGVNVNRDGEEEPMTMNKASGARRSKVSMSSFDGMYNDEMMELDIPIPAIEHNDSDVRNTDLNPQSIVSQRSLTDAPLDEIGENHVMSDQPMQDRHSSPRKITSTRVVTQEVASPQNGTSTLNSTSFPKTPSCSSLYPGGMEAILVAPPKIHRTSSLASSDIFRIQGTDSGLSSVVGGNIGEDGAESTTTSVSSIPARLVSNRSQQSGHSIGNYSVIRTANDRLPKQMKRREDPPDTGFGYHPQRSADAKEPEGYKQHGLFPDIDLWTSLSCEMNERNVVPASPARKIAPTEPSNRYNEPEVYENDEGFAASDEYDDVDQYNYDRKDSAKSKAMHDDYDESVNSHDNRIVFPKIYSGLSHPSHTSSKVNEIDDMFLSDEDSKSCGSYESTKFVDNDDGISVMSDESEIGMLAKQQYHKQRLDQYKRQPHQNQRTQQSSNKSKKSYYQVKRKDSMESDINIDFSALNSAIMGSKSGNLLVKPYSEIKQSDSMEKELCIDFDEHVSQEVDEVEDDDEFSEKRNVQPQSPTSCCWDPSSDKIASPPMIKRKPFSFDRAEDDSSNEGDNLSENNDDNVVRFTDFERIRYVVTARSPDSVDGDDDGKSEDNKPIIYPCKAMSQMNVRHNHETGESNSESDHLWKLSCDHLARGRSNEALVVLTEMLQIVQRCAHDAKIRLKNFHFQKDRESDNAIDMSHLERNELEDQLDSALQNSASAMADVLNNIGVVLEVKGEYQLAMNSYQDALDMYRNTCRRYENAGDPEVDRTVNNIMQLSIAMQNNEKRLELHNEAEKLAAQTEIALGSDNHLCTELRMERLNVLMCALDLETERLGQDHPDVGFTLLKKGALHLQMNHVDMAIKDTKDAVTILKKGLGSFHPEVGFALVKLGNMFNYDLSKYGGGLKGGDDYVNMALSLYREALMPLRESFGMVNPHSGVANNCIGILYSSKGEVKHAMSSFYDALASYGVRSRAETESEARNEHKSSHPDVFFVWVNVGGLHMSKKEWQLALRSYLKAHSAFRSLHDEEKRNLPTVASKRLIRNALTMSKDQFDTVEDDMTDILLASLLYNIAKAQSMLHRYGNAIDTLEEALQIHKVFALRTAGNNQDFLGSSQDMARILENLGDVLMISGDLTSAFTRYIESLNLLRSKARAGQSSIQIALVLGGIGQVHYKKGEYAEAKVVLKESMRMFEKIGK